MRQKLQTKKFGFEIGITWDWTCSKNIPENSHQMDDQTPQSIGWSFLMRLLIRARKSPSNAAFHVSNRLHPFSIDRIKSMQCTQMNNFVRCLNRIAKFRRNCNHLMLDTTRVGVFSSQVMFNMLWITNQFRCSHGNVKIIATCAECWRYCLCVSRKQTAYITKSQMNTQSSIISHWTHSFGCIHE